MLVFTNSLRLHIKSKKALVNVKKCVVSIKCCRYPTYAAVFIRTRLLTMDSCWGCSCYTVLFSIVSVYSKTNKY